MPTTEPESISRRLALRAESSGTYRHIFNRYFLRCFSLSLRLSIRRSPLIYGEGYLGFVSGGARHWNARRESDFRLDKKHSPARFDGVIAAAVWGVGIIFFGMMESIWLALFFSPQPDFSICSAAFFG
jgi:hypothetical protein